MERELQQARIKARLAQRAAARELAVAQLATLESTLQNLPVLDETATEEEQAKVEVAKEDLSQRWLTISEHLALMNVASNKADANVISLSSGIEAEFEYKKARIEQLKVQIARDREQIEGLAGQAAGIKRFKIKAAEAEIAAHNEATANQNKEQFVRAVNAAQTELGNALVKERSVHTSLAAKLELLKSKLAPAPPPPPLSARNGTGWSLGTGSSSATMDASAVLIKHQENQADIRSASVASRSKQMAKAQARLAQRLANREEAAAKLAELEEEVEGAPSADADSAASEAALIVWQETVEQHRDDLVEQLKALNAGIASAEVAAATAMHIAGAAELVAMLAAERGEQGTLTAQMAALAAKISASKATLEERARDRKFDGLKAEMDASEVLIKHREQAQSEQTRLAAAKTAQQAKLRARLAERKRA